MESFPSSFRTYFARWALLPTGWQRDVRIEVRTDGTFGSILPSHSVEPTDAVVERIGTVLPGMVNLHSHAFQRAMAGLTEQGGPSSDSFWTWREVMYRFLAELTPDDIEAIAAQLYVELLKGGFTGVVEFHYLHRDPSGALYRNPAELGQCIMAAAEQSGIGLTLLASLYQQGGFAATPLQPRQQRFYLSDDEFARVLTKLHHRCPPGMKVGIAPHSLRAVTPDALRRAIELQTQLAPRAPIHLHIAEQPAEVSDCLSWSQRRPIAWLLDECSVDERFCLIHATMDNPTSLFALRTAGQPLDCVQAPKPTWGTESSPRRTIKQRADALALAPIVTSEPARSMSYDCSNTVSGSVSDDAMSWLRGKAHPLQPLCGSRPRKVAPKPPHNQPASWPKVRALTWWFLMKAVRRCMDEAVRRCSIARCSVLARK